MSCNVLSCILIIQLFINEGLLFRTRRYLFYRGAKIKSGGTVHAYIEATMDHLQSDEERRSRWYAKHLLPRYLTVLRAGAGDDQEADGPGAACPCCGSLSDDDNNNNNSDCIDAGHIVGIPASIFINKHDETETTQRGDGAKLLHRNLERYGFAVITDALSSQECDTALDLAWDYLEAASCVERCLQEESTRRPKSQPNDAAVPIPADEIDASLLSEPPVRRDDPKSLPSPYFPASVEGGILPFYGSGHTTFAWYLRGKLTIQSIFAALYDIPRDELITSLDGMVIWRGGKEHRTDEGWFHIDQNPRLKPTFEAVQGLVNLLPVTPRTGGNVLVAKSHKLFPRHYVGNGNGEEDGGNIGSCRDFYRSRLDEINGDDWLEIDPNDSHLLDPNHIVTCLLTCPGDVLLWDSRVVHCSYPGTDISNNDATDDDEDAALASRGLIRAAGLVTMMPRDRATEEVFTGRIEAVKLSRTLTHWADKVAPLGEEREDEVVSERQRVDLMKRMSLTSLNNKGGGILVDWSEMDTAQQRLVGSV